MPRTRGATSESFMEEVIFPILDMHCRKDVLSAALKRGYLFGSKGKIATHMRLHEWCITEFLDKFPNGLFRKAPCLILYKIAII